MRWTLDAYDADLRQRCRACGELLVPESAHEIPIWASGDGRGIPDERPSRTHDAERDDDEGE